MTIRLSIFLFIAVLLSNSRIYPNNNEFAASLTEKQSRIDEQQKEIDALKKELECKQRDIEALKSSEASEAGFGESSVIYILLFSLIAWYVSSLVSRHRTEALCRCLNRKKQILKQLNHL